MSVPIGQAGEDIACGMAVGVDPATGRLVRFRSLPRPIQLVRRHGNCYMPDRFPLGTKFFYDVYDWGQHDRLSMHLFETEKERDFYRARVPKNTPVLSGRVAFKKRPRLPSPYVPVWARGRI